MEKHKVYIRHVILCELKIKKYNTETAKKKFSVYGQGVITDQ